jgi:glycosyltransferase involved in cell wall biosynthesis
MKRSAVNFVLTQQELDELTPMGFKCQMIELPNGINVPLDIAVRKENEVPRIVFCSRLHPRKRPTAFLNLAREAFKKNFVGTFEIYGPDGSELDLIQDEIRKDEQLIYAQYKGSIAPSEVMNVLNQSDLLVLPSKNEPFPMVVLEALAVGTPILIMPSCGIASLIKDNYPMMVLESDDEDIFLASKKLLEQGYSIEFRKELQNFCNKNFGIEGVVDKLETVYLKVMMNIRSIN